MTLQELLERKPADLNQDHVRLVKHLYANPEGVTREEAPRTIGFEDRVFRKLIEEIVVAEWAPIAPDPNTGKYRIVRADEPHLVNDYHRRERAKALSTMRRVKGLERAYAAFYGGASLFLEPVQPVEGLA